MMHIFSVRSLKKAISIFTVILFVGVLFNPVEAYASNEEDIVALMNQSRKEAGLGEVVLDATLTSAAQTRARECEQRFSHIRPNGEAWYTVSALTYGENLADAVNSKQSRPENVIKAWLLSSTHRANLLKSSYTSVGVAYYYADNGNTYIVCEFN